MKERNNRMNLTYDWQPLEGLAFRAARQCDTEIGKCVVKQRRPGQRRWVAWVRGEVIGRDYGNIEAAMAHCEQVVKQRLANRAA